MKLVDLPRPLRSIPLYGYNAVAVPFYGILSGVVTAVDDTGETPWQLARMWARGVARAAGVTEVRMAGAEIPATGGLVLMANHESHLDPVSVVIRLRRPGSFLAKQELFHFPIFGWALRRNGHIPVDRSNRQRAIASVDRAANEVRGGKMVIIFPEGTRSRSGAMNPFKKGGFVMAIKAGVPIVPMGIAGTRRVLPPGMWVQGQSAIAMVTGQPIDTGGYRLEDKEALMSIVRDRITALREQARAMIA